jgi:hypothetical protein
MKLSTILDHIDSGHMALPQFQRGYVWNREQVRGLMASLYRGYPVGGFLVWATASEGAEARGDTELAPGIVKLLLDGQQRVTSLYGIIRGRTPKFFDGNERSFAGLHFNVETETFEFYAPTRMADDPTWISVSEHMQKGLAPWMEAVQAKIEPADLPRYIARLSRLEGIKEREFHIEDVTGEDKTVDVVVDIFNRVNSGGTKLSKGDLALARICGAWSGARDELKRVLGKWKQHGYDFSLDWLLRNITACLTGQAMFSGLKDVSTNQFADGLRRAESAIDTLLNTVGSRLGLDHDRVLGGRGAFPVMSRYLDQLGRAPTAAEQGQLLFWYMHALMWGRFAGSTETVLNQDLEALTQAGLDGLMRNLRAMRGDLAVRPEDFSGWSLGARFYPVLYLLTRTQGARDLGTGLQLASGMLGKLSRLEVHHIFPKAKLYEHDYRRPQVNAIANFCFLSQQTNLKISNRNPAKYLAEVGETQPGALESQWIPTDPELWELENYPAFLQARRQHLSAAANALLERLLQTAVEPVEPGPGPEPMAPEAATILPPEVDDDVQALTVWLESLGYVAPERDYVVTDPVDGTELTMVDAAWPTGIAGGYTQPIALLLEPDADAEAVLGEAGYRFFVRVEHLREWIDSTAGLEVAEPLAG